jgi:hypothetical protein
MAAPGAAASASVRNFSGVNSWAPGRAAMTLPAKAMPCLVMETTAIFMGLGPVKFLSDSVF